MCKSSSTLDYAHTGATHFSFNSSDSARVSTSVSWIRRAHALRACTYILPEARGNHRDNERTAKRVSELTQGKKSKQQKRSGTKLSPIYAGKVVALSEAGRTPGDHDQVPLLMRERNARKIFAPMWRNLELVWYANRFKNGMKCSNKTVVCL